MAVTYQSRAVDAERWLEVRRLVEVMFETLSHGVAVGANEIRLHFGLTYHPVPAQANDVRVNINGFRRALSILNEFKNCTG